MTYTCAFTEVSIRVTVCTKPEDSRKLISLCIIQITYILLMCPLSVHLYTHIIGIALYEFYNTHNCVYFIHIWCFIHLNATTFYQGCSMWWRFV